MNSMALTILLFIFDYNSKISMDILFYQIFVKGKVQGVWFRKYTCNEAKRMGLKGFVKNEVNNSVYIEVEGNSRQLNKFLQWLYKGSPLSKVSLVEYKRGELKHYQTFEIRN